MSVPSFNHIDPSYSDGYRVGYDEGLQEGLARNNKDQKIPSSKMSELYDFINDQKDIPPDFAKILEEKFWELKGD
jgi:hypothetical protein